MQIAAKEEINHVGDRSAAAVLVLRQRTVLTSHHHCSGDLIHRAVFLAAGSGMFTRDCCISGVLHQKKNTTPMWSIVPRKEKQKHANMFIITVSAHVWSFFCSLSIVLLINIDKQLTDLIVVFRSTFVYKVKTYHLLKPSVRFSYQL